MNSSNPKPWKQPDFYAGATPEALAKALLRPLTPRADKASKLDRDRLNVPKNSEEERGSVNVR